jgi:predicted peptidase
MKSVLPFLLVIPLLIFCCEKDEERIEPTPPVPPAADTVSEVTPDPGPVTPPVGLPDELPFDSAIYESGRYKDMPYRILLPKNYDARKEYPLLVFLHGVGERGIDNELQLKFGSSLFTPDSIRDKYPAFVVFPQCPKSEHWYFDWGIARVKGLVDTLSAIYLLDTARIYIAGLSMGAYGTYAVVAENPELFSAAVAISGDGDETKASAMAKTRWRIFAGKKDEVVPSGKSEKMANALRKAGASVSFTLYPDADHKGSWEKAFAEPDFCSWIFSVARHP